MEFKTGDIVYLNKRGVMKGETRDWTIIPDCRGNVLSKNKKYIIEATSKSIISLEGYSFGYNKEHFIKYEQV